MNKGLATVISYLLQCWATPLYSLSWRHPIIYDFVHNCVLFFMAYAAKTAGSISASAFTLL